MVLPSGDTALLRKCSIACFCHICQMLLAIWISLASLLWQILWSLLLWTYHLLHINSKPVSQRHFYKDVFSSQCSVSRVVYSLCLLMEVIHTSDMQILSLGIVAHWNYFDNALSIYSKLLWLFQSYHVRHPENHSQGFFFLFRVRVRLSPKGLMKWYYN